MQTVSRLRMRICSETQSISWHNKEFAQVVSQNCRWRSTQLLHVVTPLDVSRFTAFCSTIQHPVCIRPIVDSLPDFTNSSPNSFASFPNEAESHQIWALDPFTRPLDLWRSAFTGSIDSARSQPILLLLQLLKLLKTSLQRSWSGYCCC